MIVQPRPAPLSDADRALVDDARALVTSTLDLLRPRLLAATGSVTPVVKADGTPVTDLDHEVNATLVDAIAARFPDHGVVSEEQAVVTPDARFTWVIDPIDGTSNFTAGVPYWCVAIALTLDGLPVLSVVDAPPLGRRFEATAGAGAWSVADGGVPQRLAVRTAPDVDDPANRHVPLFLTSGTVRRARSRPRLRLNPRVMGSAVLDLCLVADGTGAAAISVVPKVWDLAAGALVVQEAGGAVVTLDGTPLLPLRPDNDHARASASVCAAPDLDFVDLLTTRLSPEDVDIFRSH
jgi:myo-inositol-1(or 4)-monophosphatase